ncbi:MAG: nucleotidyltransferase domain-containing protein [Nanoarchaeota archaeon]|nr:nucleotidyltransferase domain-containing protein [Nanoarchaeota archaeon]
MVLKCSYLKVLEIFFKEPIAIHFIKEVGKRIKLAPTSVRNNMKELLKAKLIIEKKSKPFNGFVANRENDKFIFYKRLYNFYTLDSLKNELVESLHPKAIVVFGSYSLGEDIETSDVDVLVVSKASKELVLKKFEKLLGRKINIIIVEDLNKLDTNIQKKVINGFVIYGGL